MGHQLRSRHTLWLHALLMGALTLLVTWGIDHALLRAGVASLALRYALALGAGYLVYLLLLRLWAHRLLRGASRGQGDGLDAGLDLPWPGGGARAPGGLHSGGAGDFGGGGAHGSFGLPEVPDVPMAGEGGSWLGDATAGALEAARGVDEGAVIVVPVLAVFVAALAAVLGGGSLLLLYFGTDALLAVAVELAFAWTAARTAARIERQGWLAAAVGLSWKPLLGALLCAVALGVLIDHFVPQASTLVQAVSILRS